MKYEVKESSSRADYLAVAVNEESHGQISSVLSSGRQARLRPPEYAVWKDNQRESPVNSGARFT